MAGRSGSTSGSGACGARRQDVGRQEEAQATLLGEGAQRLLVYRVGDDDSRAGVIDHVGELGLGVGGGEGHGHAAGAPDAPLGRGVVVAGGRQECDAGVGEVRLAVEQARGHGGGVGEELRVRERAFAGDDGRAISEALGTGYERYGRHTPLLSTAGGDRLGRLYHAGAGQVTREMRAFALRHAQGARRVGVSLWATAYHAML